MNLDFFKIWVFVLFFVINVSFLPAYSEEFEKLSIELTTNTNDIEISNENNTLKNPQIYYSSTMLSCNCVAFKLDDIQDYWLSDVQVKLIKLFSKNEFPITIGVISKTFGNDAILLDTIKNGVKNNEIEIANHSLSNEPMTSYAKQGQDYIIKKTTNKINATLNVVPKVFIPPENKFNDDTITVLRENGYTHLAASIDVDPPPYPLEGESFYRFPGNAFTAEWVESEGFVGSSAEKTFSEILEGLDMYGYAVVTIHPQEFSILYDGVLQNEINEKQFKELETLIEKIKLKNITVVPIGEIDKNISKNILSDKPQNSSDEYFIPGWIKNTAGWWRDGHIGDVSFVQAIQFLIQEGILQTPEINPGSGDSQIPEWVKENSGWWAEGKISNNEFINGINFLINQGIIIIKA